MNNCYRISTRFKLITGMVMLVTICAMACLWLFPSSRKPKPVSSPQSITVLWAQWPPADYLQALSEEFTRETGIQVKVVQKPWGTWQTLFFDEMAKKGQTYDMVIGDSQWLGRGATEGHYIELTYWIETHGVDKSMTAASIKGYSEFPKGSGHLWAVPVEGDAMGFSYRKDLFEDPREKASFQARFGYPLKTPESWQQLKDIAEHFYRPDKDLYGVLVWVEPHYDGITMGVQSLVWAWGADLGDPATYRVKGILNSPRGVEALEFYKALNQYNNPQWIHNYLDTDANSNQPMMDGKVAMSMVYFAIAPDLLDPLRNPYADKVGFFANPRGPGTRVCSLGGQGISIVSYTKRKAPCLKFLEWFVQDRIQEKWSQMGGLSCNKRVLSSEAFLNASPINRPFKESIEMARDFWAVPEYPELLRISQKYWFAYVVEGSISAKEAMNGIAREWENVFEYSGYYKE